MLVALCLKSWFSLWKERISTFNLECENSLIESESALWRSTFSWWWKTSSEKRGTLELLWLYKLWVTGEVLLLKNDCILSIKFFKSITNRLHFSNLLGLNLRILWFSLDKWVLNYTDHMIAVLGSTANQNFCVCHDSDPKDGGALCISR